MANILVVDDESRIRDLLKIILKRNNHDVAEAADGMEALRIMHSGPLPDLVLMDHQMPALSGIDCARALKLIHPSLRIVLISGSFGSYDDGALVANKHLFSDIILKPFQVRDVISTVEYTLGSEAVRKTGYSGGSAGVCVN